MIKLKLKLGGKLGRKLARGYRARARGGGGRRDEKD